MLADALTTTSPAAVYWPSGARRQFDRARPGDYGSLRFGRFHVHPGARALLRDGKPVEVGSRAFDLLVRLLRSRGQIVSKTEIIAHVWPSIFVEESNLRFQVAQLRKALGDHGAFIKTVPGRGYLLAAAEAEAGVAAQPRAGDKGEADRSSDPSSHNGAGSSSSSDGSHPATGTKAPILAIIDPDEEAARGISRLLGKHGLEIRHFESAEAFLASGTADYVDCVILDVWLPGRNGLQLQAEFTKAGGLVPFIFVSSHADVDSAVRAMKAGASEFFTKPLRHVDFVKAVRHALGLEPVAADSE